MPNDNNEEELAVRVDGLRYSYGDYEAVRGIDLEVHRGELFAVLGTNGAGKTTVLEILEGVRPAAEGVVRVLGLDPLSQRRRLATRAGVMFQDTALPDELTPIELLELWRHLAAGVRAHRPVGNSLDLVGLAHRADIRIGRLSGGERRRLDLAVALSTDPELLFLDEPTAGLDPESRADTWQLVRDLLRRGTTIVLTTHYLEEAEALADRIAILHEGRVEVSGTLKEVLSTIRSSIHCDIPPHLAPARNDLVGDVIVTTKDQMQHLEIRTRDLPGDLKTLLEWSESHDQPLADLQTSKPSLAEVFHEIVNPTISEEAA